MSWKVLLKLLLASLKILTNSRYFTGRIRISTPHPNGTGGNSKEFGSLISAFEDADNQSSTSYEK